MPLLRQEGGDFPGTRNRPGQSRILRAKKASTPFLFCQDEEGGIAAGLTNLNYLIDYIHAKKIHHNWFGFRMRIKTTRRWIFWRIGNIEKKTKEVPPPGGFFVFLRRHSDDPNYYLNNSNERRGDMEKVSEEFFDLVRAVISWNTLLPEQSLRDLRGENVSANNGSNGNGNGNGKGGEENKK